MKIEETVPLIYGWFAAVKVASLKLPNGWFGRPYDGQHRLNWAKVRGSELEIVFDDHQNISMSEPIDIETHSDSLRIVSSSHIVWRWVEYGSTRTHEEVFKGGAVEFLTPFNRVD